MAVPGRSRPGGGLNSSRSQLLEGRGNEPRVRWDGGGGGFHIGTSPVG